jgi:hypothetical protein
MTDNRTYYYDIYGKIRNQDYESMVAYRLDEGVLFVTTAIDRCTQKECLGLYILINDYFCSRFQMLSLLLMMNCQNYLRCIKRKQWNGVSKFVADKRGIPNIYLER